MIKVLIVEKDSMLREFLLREVEGFSNLVSMEVRTSTTINDSIRILGEWVPNILLLDLSLSYGSGVEVANRYASMPGVGKIMILTGQIDSHPITPNSWKGILYVILNKTDGIESLRSALWDLIPLCDCSLPDISKLTKRQMEILRLVGMGKDTFEIADKLGISFATAQTHRRRITKKLGITGSRLVALARILPRMRPLKRQ